MLFATLFLSSMVTGCCDAGPDEPTYSDVSSIFDESCGGSACHTDGGEGGGTPLDVDLDALVDVPSEQDEDVVLISPGSPDDSYLMRKILGTGSQSQMPLGGTMSSCDMDTIERWIEDGAPE